MQASSVQLPCHNGQNTKAVYLYECSNGAQWAGAGDVLVLRVEQDGGVAGTLTSLHLHLHQTVPVPGTVLHQID